MSERNCSNSVVVHCHFAFSLDEQHVRMSLRKGYGEARKTSARLMSVVAARRSCCVAAHERAVASRLWS
jgi:hypothetical protein